MGKEWDAPWKANGWQSGGGFSKPGIGERKTEWPSFSATSKFGAVNPTCNACGGRARGKNRCECSEPQWKPIGKRRNPENEGLPSDITTFGMGNHLRAFQAWCELWSAECFRILKPNGIIKAFSGTRTFHRMSQALKKSGFVDFEVHAWTYGSGFPKSMDVSKQIDKRGGASDSRKEFHAHLAERVRASGLSRADISEHITGARTGSCWNWEHFSLPEPHFWEPLKSLLGLDSAYDSLILGEDRDVIEHRTMTQGGGSSLHIRMGERRDVEANITAPATEAAKQWSGYGTALKPAWEPIVVARKPL